MDPENQTAPTGETGQSGFRLETGETGLTLHIPPLPDLPGIALWLALAALMAFLLLWKPNRIWIAKRWRGLTGFLQRNYLTILIPLGFLLIGWAFAAYIWQIPFLIGQMLTKLKSEIGGADTEAIRNIGYTFAALAGMLAILATIPFQLVRVWINERTATTQEANLTTGLINTAVEGLGAEKKVSRIGRTVTFTREGEPVHTAIEWQDGAPPEPPPGEDWKLEKPGDWQTFDQTRPNLEVRVGAILTLDRIARENPGEHIRVMDILCAYIRENAPAKDAKNHHLGPWPDYPENATAGDLEKPRKRLDDRAKDLRDWIKSLPEPRTDIQTALTTLGHRDPERIAREEANHTRGGEPGYRLDLRETNLRKCDLSHLNLDRARLDGARMEGAHLSEVRMEGADLREARMEWTDLREARMEGADLREARMEWADLRGARMEGADLSGARMEGVNLWYARMEGANLWQARMEGADLSGARMEGAKLVRADLKSALWADTQAASSAKAADIRGAQYLSQAQLDQMIGNAATLLPEGPAPDTKKPYSIPSCWIEPPAAFVEKMRRWGYDWEKDPDGYRCPPGQEPARTGTPLALDAPYPEGHPLAERDEEKKRNTGARRLS